MLVTVAQALGEFGDRGRLIATRLVGDPELKRHNSSIPGVSDLFAATEPLME